MFQDTSFEVDSIQNRDRSMQTILQIRKINGVQSNFEFSHFGPCGFHNDIDKLNCFRRIGVDAMRVAL